MTNKQKLGGQGRATALTARERSAIASHAARARWGTSTLLKATHGGKLRIGEGEVDCYVLDNGTRVLSTNGLKQAFGSKSGGSRGDAAKRRGSVPGLPYFLASETVKAALGADLIASLSSPIIFQVPNRGGAGAGYPATLLPDLCDAILDADKADGLRPEQRYLAEAASLIVRALSRVGVVALVDEVTGYQEARERDALFKILEAYIVQGMLPWTRRFPPSFFQEIYRLYGWKRPEGKNPPQVVGTLINKLIYAQLPPGVLEELREKNPMNEAGRRRFCPHQFLTEHVGHPHLDKQIASVLALMRASADKKQFFALFDRAFPKPEVIPTETV